MVVNNATRETMSAARATESVMIETQISRQRSLAWGCRCEFPRCSWEVRIRYQINAPDSGHAFRK